MIAVSYSTMNYKDASRADRTRASRAADFRYPGIDLAGTVGNVRKILHSVPATGC